MSVRWVVAVLMSGLAASVPVLAHHSFAAEFDDTKPVKVTGVVPGFEYVCEENNRCPGGKCVSAP